jgi:ataxin-3
VFAVTQADPEAPLALPRTEADMIASTLPEPTGSSMTRIQRPFTSSSSKPGAQDSSKTAAVHEGFEDEDYELQAALQASLMGTRAQAESSQHDSPQAPSIPPLASLSPLWSPPAELTSPVEPESGSRTPLLRPARTIPLPGHADLDPVAASMERNRVLLQRMREQQEFAQREMWTEADLMPEEQAALEERRELRRRQDEEEEAELRRAIEESEALANQHRLQRGSNTDTDMHENTSALQGDHIHYDDDDAELQAALRASLESAGVPSSSHDQADDEESVFSDTTSTDITVDQSDEPPSLEEIRKRRLARFGL